MPPKNFGHMRNFFDCIKSGKLPVANVFDHVRSVNACHFANIAMLVGRKIAMGSGSTASSSATTRPTS